MIIFILMCHNDDVIKIAFYYIIIIMYFKH